jgi:hypothetical protein
MKLRYVLILSFFCFFLSDSISYPEISQYFDGDGHPFTPEGRNRDESPADGIERYSVPEGIVLQKNIRYEFYPVFGKTFSEIVQSAEENMPVEPEEKRGIPSRFDWTVGWNYKVDYSEEIDEEGRIVRVSAEIYDIRMDYDLKITLPTLIDDTVLNPAEKKLWKNYYMRLLGHEYDRANMVRGKAAQEELRKKFTDLNNTVFVFSTDIDIQRTLEAFMKKETQRLGAEWIRNLKKTISEHEKETE